MTYKLHIQEEIKKPCNTEQTFITYNAEKGLKIGFDPIWRVIRAINKNDVGCPESLEILMLDFRCWNDDNLQIVSHNCLITWCFLLHYCVHSLANRLFRLHPFLGIWQMAVGNDSWEDHLHRVRSGYKLEWSKIDDLLIYCSRNSFSFQTQIKSYNGRNPPRRLTLSISNLLIGENFWNEKIL